MAHAASARQLGYDLVAVASRTHERAAKLAGTFGGNVVTYANLPGSAELVIVATPPQCHANDAIRLLDAGVAVLLEKPLCRTLDEADRIVAAAARNGERLLYAENLAYAPLVQQMIGLVPHIGVLTHLQVKAVQGLPTWGDFTSDEWGGGALFDLGAHPLAVALLLASAAGQGRPISVSAVLDGGTGHASDEHAEVMLRYRSGLVAKVVASWKSGPEPAWDAQIAGNSGALRAEILPFQSLEHNGEAVPLTPTTWPIPELQQYGYAGQLQALVADVAAQRQPVMSAAFGREVLQVTLAAYASAGARGSEVDLPFSGPTDLTPLQLWRRG